MAFYLAHAGTKLYKVDVNGVAVELTLPAGVTLSSTRRARFLILERTILCFHAPSRPIMIDPNLVVRILTPVAPAAGLTGAASGVGTFTGTYTYVVTFAITDGTRILSESPESAETAVVAATNAQFDLTNIPVSTDPGVNARRIWRTTVDGGEVFYRVTTIYNNADTTYTDTTADAGLPVNDLLSDELGEPMGNTDPAEYFEIGTVWKDRAWAAGNVTPDRVFYSGNLAPWAWSPEAYVTAKPSGQDLEGASGFLPRRDELGIGKRRSLWKVIGSDPVNFDMIRVVEGTGIWAPESALVIRDEGYFLAEDGVYKWGPGGLKNLSKERVHSWFTSDAYFNRARFPYAFAKHNQRFNTYELHLAAAGSDVNDRWVSLDLETGRWMGPHLTGAFTPSCGGVLEDDDGLVTPFIGGTDGIIYKCNQPDFTDAGTAIDFDVTTKRHSQGDPERTKYWGEMSIHTKAEAAGTLTITPSVGDLAASAGIPISHDLTRTRRRLRRIGVGRFVQFRLQNAENNQGVEVRGYEIEPVSDLGRR